MDEIFTVKFSSNFDVFAANVAFKLRSLIIYRTDGGRYARGLVRAPGDLQKIHAALLRKSTSDGDPITLVARVYRRQDPVPSNRFVLSIRFIQQQMMDLRQPTL